MSESRIVNCITCRGDMRVSNVERILTIQMQRTGEKSLVQTLRLFADPEEQRGSSLVAPTFPASSELT
jgi:hypothetical protein